MALNWTSLLHILAIFKESKSKPMSLFQQHEALIQRVIQAIEERTFYTPYPEHHKAYPEAGMAEGEAWLNAQLRHRFEGLQQGEPVGYAGEENSPYTGDDLGITYPTYRVEQLMQQAEATRSAWKARGPKERAGILAETLDRLNAEFFKLAHATIHTTGQSFMMAFQASGPHSSDRAMEALALGYQEQTRYPEAVEWVKPMGKSEVRLHKTWKPVPRGIGLVIGCSTFPVWNTVPGMFASLVTGNPVIVKPHPKAVLPIAVVVAALQQVLVEQGCSPHVIQLAVDTSDEPLALTLAEHSHVQLIDYTGSSSFGNVIEQVPGKITFTEKAGVNSVLLESMTDLDAVLSNLAFSVTLYSGQMCTAPQNFYVPKDGVVAGGQRISFDEVVERFKQAVDDVVNHPKMGAGTMAALQSEQTMQRIKEIQQLEGVVRSGEFLPQESRACSPTIRVVNAEDRAAYEQELFGPIVLLVKTEDADHSVQLARAMAQNHGAITCAAYALEEERQAYIEEQMELAFTQVSFNLTGFIWVNQAAAFSDFHVTGGNPAGNASFANPEYVNKRFVWVGHRRMK